MLDAWIAVSEIACARGKSRRSALSTLSKLVAAATALSAVVAQAGPVGAVVASGSGSIAQSGTTTTINQSSPHLSLNWKSFNVAPSETVNFVQPSATAVAVNRIYDTNGSQIMGRLNANGQVYLINPNGVLFGQGAQVNVGALVASTLDFNDASLGSQTRSFSGTGTGSVVNLGAIDAAGANGSGGFVALLGNSVGNQGSISAPGGTVALGAGSAVTLTFQNSSLVQMKIDQSVLDSQSANGGVIRANGGRVLMSAGAQDALLASVVNNTGVIEARTVENHGGTIVLLGGMAAGTTHVGGTLDASAPHGGDGGLIETSAAHVMVADTARISTAAASGKTGTWLIDPVGFVIAATGGDITGASLGTLLENNSVTVQTLYGSDTDTNRYGAVAVGVIDIFVNDPVSWNANTRLTLQASRNININQSITATSGQLSLLYGQLTPDGVLNGVTSTYNVNAPVNLPPGPNFSTQLGSGGAVKNFTVITTLGAENSTTATDLQGMGGSLSTNYALGSNIDASATARWNSDLAATPTYAGFVPIGYLTTLFEGTFDGLGHTISNLSINRPTTSGIGLFGYTDRGSAIQNLGLLRGSFSGDTGVAGLVGVNQGTVNHSYMTGNVAGLANVGGLVGFNFGALSNSYATGNVAGQDNVGGLVGTNAGAVSNSYATGDVSGNSSVGGAIGFNIGSEAQANVGTVTNSYATGKVYGRGGGVGGLVGFDLFGVVSNSHATGAVSGQDGAGGLVGGSLGSIDNSYATGAVSGRSRVGGLAGVVGVVSNSYATGDVIGDDHVGGLAGSVSITLDNSYATGAVTGTSVVGGLLGNNDGSVSNSYWNTDKTAVGIGAGSTTGATGLTSAQMQNAANFTGFKFTTTPGVSGNNWVIVNADGTVQTSTDTSGGATTPMLASEYSTNIQNAHQLQLMAMAPTARYTLGNNVNAATTGFVGGVSTDVWNSAGFVPIGNAIAPFTGTFDGQGRTVSNLKIYRPATDDVGLFGNTDAGSSILNVGLLGGSITGNDYVGGLVGRNRLGVVSGAYSTATVSGNNYVGGLVGVNSLGTVSTSYSTGTVSGLAAFVGGLVANSSGTVSNSYAVGEVSGNSYVGGLLGRADGGTVTNSYWNTDRTALGVGVGSQAGATGLSSAQMQRQGNFSGYDFGTTWVIYDGHTNPLLRAFMTPLTVTADNIVKTYDGQTTAGTGISYSSTPDLTFLGTLDYNGALNVGTYAPSGFYSDQQGYLISYTNGTLTINQRPLTVTADAKTKTYGDLNPSLTYTVAADGVGTSRGLVNGDTLSGSLSTTATQASGVGSYTIDASALSNGNYVVTADNGMLTISPLSTSSAAPSDEVPKTTTVPRLLLGEKQIAQRGEADMNVRIVGAGVKLPLDMLDLTE